LPCLKAVVAGRTSTSYHEWHAFFVNTPTRPPVRHSHVSRGSSFWPADHCRRPCRMTVTIIIVRRPGAAPCKCDISIAGKPVCCRTYRISFGNNVPCRLITSRSMALSSSCDSIDSPHWLHSCHVASAMIIVPPGIFGGWANRYSPCFSSSAFRTAHGAFRCGHDSLSCVLGCDVAQWSGCMDTASIGTLDETPSRSSLLNHAKHAMFMIPVGGKGYF